MQLLASVCYCMHEKHFFLAKKSKKKIKYVKRNHIKQYAYRGVCGILYRYTTVWRIRCELNINFNLALCPYTK